jgi:2-oxoisovalerate dehydrogenase E2 component (dihydrolipoyl transacylase)
MGTYIFKLPDLGEGIVESEVVTLYVKVGDMVKEDQPIIDMMTDKATVELPSPASGKVTAIGGAEGEMVAVGGMLFTFEVEGEGTASAAPVAVKAEPVKETVKTQAVKEEPPKAGWPESKVKMPAMPKAAALSAASAGSKPKASPAIRRRAEENNIDLGTVSGSGPAGRITHQDLDDFIACGGRLSAGAKVADTSTQEIPVKGIRRKIAEQMELSKRTIPHYSYIEEIDVTDIEALRNHMNASREEGQVKLSILPFILMAVTKAAKKFPQVNAHYDRENSTIIRFKATHLGVAAQTPNGLMVPVVAHAEMLDIWTLASEMMRVTGAARDGKAKREELSGSTITVTSLGKIGGIVTTPVINVPEVAIVGVCKIAERPMVVGGQVVIRKMMNLSSSFDHRVVDGYEAAEMIQCVKAYLEHPATLFI